MYIKTTYPSGSPTFERCTACGSLWYKSPFDRLLKYTWQPFEAKLGRSTDYDRCPNCTIRLKVYHRAIREKANVND